MGVLTLGADVARDAGTQGGLEEAGFEATVRRHYRLVFAVAHQVLGSAKDAEDAAQEAFLKAFRGRASLDRSESIGGWLAAIARHAAVDLQRRRGREEAARRHATEQMARPQPQPAAQDKAAEAADERARLRAAVSTLAPHEAVVVTLRFEEGLSATEIAARLGVEAGTVRVRLHRALKRLREVLDPGGAGGGGAPDASGKVGRADEQGTATHEGSGS